VICNDEDTDGRARVTTDEEWVHSLLLQLIDHDALRQQYDNNDVQHKNNTVTAQCMTEPEVMGE